MNETLPVRYEDPRAHVHFTLTNEPRRISSEVGKVHLDSDAVSSCIATVYFDPAIEQYWATVREVDGTRRQDTPLQVLEEVVRMHVLGSLGEKHPVIAAAYRYARHLHEEMHKTIALTPEDKTPDQYKRVIQAEARYEGALGSLAQVLAAAGYDVLRRDLPSLEEAERHLHRWTENREREALHRALSS